MLSGSRWEENFRVAMLQRKRIFEQQVPFFGGWHRGGTVVDFLDTTPGLPRPTAIFVDGPRHNRLAKTGKTLEDMLKRARLEKIGIDVKVIEDEAESVEGCLKWIREELG